MSWGQLAPLWRRWAMGGLLAGVAALTVWWVFSWGLWHADFKAASGGDCSGRGACWAFVTSRLPVLLFGFYPPSGYWRIGLFFAVIGGLLVALAIPGLKGKRILLACHYVSLPLGLALILRGGWGGMPAVPTDLWGGLFLTLVVTITGISYAFPLGLLLAVWRVGRLPVMRAFAVAVIELCRSVPLITLLFMASVMLPFFLPQDLEFDKLWRALVALSIFGGAYFAEVVRGGIQAVGPGQWEAAAALGLSKRQGWVQVVLPQALRHVIPGLANTGIGMFKDTSLVLIIGMFDLLGAVQAANADPGWLGFALEGYAFAGALYFAGCYGLSRYSRFLESRLDYR